MNNNITVVGNIGKDPEIKFAESGTAVTSLSIGTTARVRQGKEWVDGDTVWWKATFFGKKAEEIVDTYSKGMRVEVTGQFGQSHWVDKEGKPRTNWEINNPEIALKPWEKSKQSQQQAQIPAPVVKTLPTTPVLNDVAPF